MYRTFDLLHYEHITLLRRVKVKENYIVVALSTDGLVGIKSKGNATFLKNGNNYLRPYAM